MIFKKFIGNFLEILMYFLQGIELLILWNIRLKSRFPQPIPPPLRLFLTGPLTV